MERWREKKEEPTKEEEREAERGAKGERGDGSIIYPGTPHAPLAFFGEKGRGVLSHAANLSPMSVCFSIDFSDKVWNHFQLRV